MRTPKVGSRSRVPKEIQRIPPPVMKHEGVNEEGVARETILSHPLALSYLECLCIRCLDPLHNTRYSHLCQMYF